MTNQTPLGNGASAVEVRLDRVMGSKCAHLMSGIMTVISGMSQDLERSASNGVAYHISSFY